MDRPIGYHCAKNKSTNQPIDRSISPGLSPLSTCSRRASAACFRRPSPPAPTPPRSQGGEQPIDRGRCTGSTRSQAYRHTPEARARRGALVRTREEERGGGGGTPHGVCQSSLTLRSHKDASSLVLRVRAPDIQDNRKNDETVRTHKQGAPVFRGPSSPTPFFLHPSPEDGGGIIVVLITMHAVQQSLTNDLLSMIPSTPARRRMCQGVDRRHVGRLRFPTRHIDDFIPTAMNKSSSFRCYGL